MQTLVIFFVLAMMDLRLYDVKLVYCCCILLHADAKLSCVLSFVGEVGTQVHQNQGLFGEKRGLKIRLF